MIADSEDKGDIDGATVGDQVASQVDKRLKDIEERHAREIQELQKGQQEILELLKAQAKPNVSDE